MSVKKISNVNKNLSIHESDNNELQFVNKFNKIDSNTTVKHTHLLKDGIDYSILEPCYFIAHVKERKRMNEERDHNEIKNYNYEDRKSNDGGIDEEDMGYKVFSVDNPKRMVWPRKQYIENSQNIISDKYNGSSAPHITMLVRQFKIRGIIWEEISLTIPENVNCKEFGIEPLNKYETREFKLGWNLTINEYNDFINQLSTTSLTSSSRFFNYKNILNRGEEKYDNIIYVNYRENGFSDRSYYSNMKSIHIHKFKKEYEEKERQKELEELRRKNTNLQRQVTSLQKDIRDILNNIS